MADLQRNFRNGRHEQRQPKSNTVPVSHRVVSHVREAVQQAIAGQPHVQWTSIRRDDHGTAWCAYGTEFVIVDHQQRNA